MQTGFTNDDVREELARILATPAFRNSPLRRRLLAYVVETPLAGGCESLKEYAIGLEVFDRPESFDPRLDSVVRVHASQLRKKLREYYEVNGSNASVRITIPPGSYKPVFEGVNHALAPEVVDDGAQLAIASDSPGLLVLPCADLDAPDRSSFSDGLTDELIIALANLNDMRIVPGLHHFCASTELFIRRAARRGVTAVLDTSVRCAGERIRMTVRLLHVHTLHIAWAQRFEAHAANVFASQEKLAHAVAEAVAAQFGLSNVRASLE